MQGDSDITNIEGIERLDVDYKGVNIGSLVQGDNHLVSFAYSSDWLEDGFSISPFSLPLKEQVFTPTKRYFDGLFGVFADSIPDSWGSLLFDRFLKKHGLNTDIISPLYRLAVVGDYAAGALIFLPSVVSTQVVSRDDLDTIALECRDILTSDSYEGIDELFAMGGSSGGTRPKVTVDIDGEDWIIKFPANTDSDDIGLMEYDYAKCAVKCGIEMSDVRLFPSKKCEGYFGAKRFDRKQDGERVHMVSAAGLLELDYNQPSLDYSELMKLVKIMTGSNKKDLMQMYRVMCFNVFAHNQDDHSKNFSFLYDDAKNVWRLAPAYDLTYSRTYFGEHTTSVGGEGKHPGKEHILSVAKDAGIKQKLAVEVMNEIENIVLQSNITKYKT